MSPAAPVTDLRRATAWAAYLGASWTWVIGMFLPVLLIRDYGPPAWFIFAIPNVVGAAAMGWAIHSRDHSLMMVVRHRAATQAFSIVTVGFHVFVLLWLVPQLAGNLFAAVAFGVALLVMVPLLVTSVQQTAMAVGALAVSVVIFTIMAGTGSLGWPRQPTGAAFDLLSLAAVSTLGFLTCPYLDLTFHRARQACLTRDESKFAFGVGFGVFFHAMIIFTLLYAGVLIERRADRTIGTLLAIHLCVQAIFTIGIHTAAIRGSVSTPGGNRQMTLALWAAVVVPVIAALASRALEAHGFRLGHLYAGEIVYRTFLSFYGLIAPAYVWLCVYPGRGFTAPHRRELQMFALAVIAAAPFFWIAFMHAAMYWVLPGIAIVLAARLFVDYSRRDHLAEQRASMPKPERK